MRYLAVIPARAGSKGVPNKNVRKIHGHPLIAWSVRQALAVPEIANVVVSTDGPEIARLAREYGAETPFLRKPIGFVRLPAAHAAPGTPFEVDVEGRLARARVVTLPFYHRSER